MKRYIKSWVLFGFLIAHCPVISDATPLDEMISPVTHPTVFEDPRHSSELRPLYIYHEIDDEFVSEGGNVQIYALQARFKLHDDLSIIATKDGYVDLNPNAVVPKGTGFANVGLGLKYSPYITDTSILTGGLRYEAPLGESEVLQGKGDGDVNPFVSAGVTINNINVLVNTGFRIAIDNSYSSFYDLNLHTSYKLGNFYPLAELGVVTVVDDGSVLPIADEGEDFFNLGASTSSGKTISTFALGARYRITDNLDIGAAWQFPLDTGAGTHIIDNRTTVDLIWRFAA